MKRDGVVDYYANEMWSICRPTALKAHDLALGTGEVGGEATPPFVMRTLYGRDRVRVLTAVRHPVDRLETSFWAAQPLRQKVRRHSGGAARVRRRADFRLRRVQRDARRAAVRVHV